MKLEELKVNIHEVQIDKMGLGFDTYLMNDEFFNDNIRKTLENNNLYISGGHIKKDKGKSILMKRIQRGDFRNFDKIQHKLMKELGCEYETHNGHPIKEGI